VSKEHPHYTNDLPRACIYRGDHTRYYSIDDDVADMQDQGDALYNDVDHKA
jgi:hypothetical protein